MRRRPLRELRRSARRAGRAVLARWARRPASCAPLDPRTLRRILIVRLNHRLGNLVLLSPLVRSLARSVPGCAIDLLVGSEAHCSVFDGMHGVARTLALPQRPAAAPLRFVRRLHELRRAEYDLAVDPCLNSASGRFVLGAVRAAARLGFAADSRAGGLSHAVAPALELEHEALRPLALLRAAFEPGHLQLEPRLDLELRPEELAAGRARLAAALGDASAPAIGVFREAAGTKRIEPAWWQALCAELARRRPGLRLVQLVPPGEPADLGGVAGVSCAEPRGLAAMLAALDLFVSGDTGPMHLASAAGVPTVGLFVTTDPRLYGPLGPRDLTLGPTVRPACDVAQLVLLHLDRIDATCQARER